MVEIKTESFIDNDLGKWSTMDLVDRWRYDLGFSVEGGDSDKPWGAYWKISRSQTEMFVNMFFPEQKESLFGNELSLCPKLLLVAPEERLSWQYHERRKENWKVVFGKVGVVTSESDVEGEERVMEKGDGVVIGEEVRHRLNGKEGWGLVAEIWTHTDPDYPSDEEDIVRLQDDYARS